MAKLEPFTLGKVENLGTRFAHTKLAYAKRMTTATCFAFLLWRWRGGGWMGGGG